MWPRKTSAYDEMRRGSNVLTSPRSLLYQKDGLLFLCAGQHFYFKAFKKKKKTLIQCKCNSCFVYIKVVMFLHQAVFCSGIPMWYRCQEIDMGGFISKPQLGIKPHVRLTSCNKGRGDGYNTQPLSNPFCNKVSTLAGKRAILQVMVISQRILFLWRWMLTNFKQRLYDFTTCGLHFLLTWSDVPFSLNSWSSFYTLVNLFFHNFFDSLWTLSY